MRKSSAVMIALAVLSLSMPMTQAADAQAGKAKASSCLGCHGPEGKGSGPNPAIAGLPEKDFIAAMEAYKSGARKNSVMHAMTQGLSDEDIANLAAYFASLKK
jgi:cytochrome c553